MGYRIDQGVKVECWEIRVLCFDEDNRGCVVPREVDMEGEGVVEIRKGDTILRPQWLTNDYLVDVIKLVPVLIPKESLLSPACKCTHIPIRPHLPYQLLILHEWFKLWSSRNGNVECFSCEERLEIKEVEVVVINKICQQLVAKTIEGGHNP